MSNPASVTKEDVDRFVEGLEEQRLRDAYKASRDIVIETEDTLCHEFQIAATINDVFWKYVQLMATVGHF